MAPPSPRRPAFLDLLRLVPRAVSSGGDGVLSVLAVDDIIADRLGQFASGSAPEMMVHARIVWRLYLYLDLGYRERRIREEALGHHGSDILGP